MKIAPQTKDEWIGFCLLPAKVFYLAFFFIGFLASSRYSFEFRSPICEAILKPCLFLSGPFLLLGALVQAIFCKRGSASRTLLFLLAGYAFLFLMAISLALILWVPFLWVLWRFIRPTMQRKLTTIEEPIECINCHETIPSGECRCVKCGWTFKNE